MHRIRVDECPVGPEMDAAVAEALGLHEFNDWPEKWKYIISHNWNKIPYSTDIAAAWEIVEGLTDFEIMLEDWKGNTWFCYAGDCGRAETAPLAICRAFLKANGVEFVETIE